MAKFDVYVIEYFDIVKIYPFTFLGYCWFAIQSLLYSKHETAITGK